MARRNPFLKSGYEKRNKSAKEIEFRFMHLMEARNLLPGDSVWFIATDGYARQARVQRTREALGQGPATYPDSREVRHV